GGEQPSELAIAAAFDCLAKTGVQATEIDLIIYFGENYADHLIYNLAGKVQGTIGATNAWGYSIDTKCGTAIVALEQAKMYMETNPEINTVMLVAGYRNVDKIDYTDKNVSFLFNVSCGGGACILRRGHMRKRVLSAAAMMDGSFADSILIPGGGTKCPITSENMDDPYLRYFRLEEPEAFRERLGKITLPNLAAVLEKALAKCGKTKKDLDFLCALLMNVKSHEVLFELLGVPLDRGIYLADYGHVGQIDPLISLDLADQSGLLSEGDIVGVSAMGMGYIWNGAVIEW
ncbi:MAG: hypothetical protein FWC72_03000, partial [Oscillospiraceae bacterium]|nr:hypothetical protein [Oscillospiraceae bacterium]